MFTCLKNRRDTAFRVTIHDFARAFELQLEGPLTAAEAPEVEARWRTASSIIGKRSFRVDLRAVGTVDAAGRGLLGRMRDDGAELIASGPETAELVREIAGLRPAASAPRAHGHLALRDLPVFLACLISHLRAWAA